MYCFLLGRPSGGGDVGSDFGAVAGKWHSTLVVSTVRVQAATTGSWNEALGRKER